MADADDGAPTGSENGPQYWQRVAAYLGLGLAAGGPGAQTMDALHNLPELSDLNGFEILSVVTIGTIAIARLALAPIIDAVNPPLLKRLGRRRGWAAVLITLQLAVTIPLVAGAWTESDTRPSFPGLMLLALVVACGLLAVVDGLRSAEPDTKSHGVLAAAQYVGAVVPFLVMGVFFQRQDNPAYNIVLCVLLAFGWLGLWLIPNREPRPGRVFELPPVKTFVDTTRGFSPGGKIVLAWLYGVFVCPITAFFQRFGRKAWVIFAVLLFADVGTELRPDAFADLYANTNILQTFESILPIISIAQLCGALLAAYLVWRYGPNMGLAAAIVVFALSLVIGAVAVATAPIQTPYLLAFCAYQFAEATGYVAYAAFLSRLVTLRFAAFQFSLLWIVGLPSRQLEQIRAFSISSLGNFGSHVFYLLVLGVAVAMIWRLARRLNAPTTGQPQS